MKTASYYLVTFIAGVTILIFTLDGNSVFSSTTENNTVLEQAMKSLEANQKKSSATAPEAIPAAVPPTVQEITGKSMMEGVYFTWIIITSDKEISVNLRYVGDGTTTPTVSVTATAITKSADGKSATMNGNSVLNAGWISPHTLDIPLNGESTLYDATSINVVASPSGSSVSPPSPAVVQSTSPPSSAASTPSPQSKIDFTNSNYAILFAKPDSYLDSTVDFTGKISNFPAAGVLQMYPGEEQMM